MSWMTNLGKAHDWYPKFIITDYRKLYLGRVFGFILGLFLFTFVVLPWLLAH